MLALGSLAFASPWLLAALAALPVIWWLLRVTPPAPRRIVFPAIRLLLGLTPREETPARTPWWLILLRTVLPHWSSSRWRIPCSTRRTVSPAPDPSPSSLTTAGPRRAIGADGRPRRSISSPKQNGRIGRLSWSRRRRSPPTKRRRRCSRFERWTPGRQCRRCSRSRGRATGRRR